MKHDGRTCGLDAKFKLEFASNEEEPWNQSSLCLFEFPVGRRTKANSLLGFPAVQRLSLFPHGIRDAQQWQNF